MANISIRKLDEKTYHKLCMRASQHGVSMEEEARQILSRAVAAPEKVSTIFRNHFGKKNGVDLTSPHRRTPHQPMDFDE